MEAGHGPQQLRCARSTWGKTTNNHTYEQTNKPTNKQANREHKATANGRVNTTQARAPAQPPPMHRVPPPPPHTHNTTTTPRKKSKPRHTTVTTCTLVTHKLEGFQRYDNASRLASCCAPAPTPPPPPAPERAPVAPTASGTASRSNNTPTPIWFPPICRQRSTRIIKEGRESSGEAFVHGTHPAREHPTTTRPHTSHMCPTCTHTPQSQSHSPTRHNMATHGPSERASERERDRRFNNNNVRGLRRRTGGQWEHQKWGS